MPCRHGGLRDLPLLGARADRAWPPSQADAADLREGLRQAQQERRHRRGGDLRGGDTAFDALRAGQDRRPASGLDAAPRPRAAGSPAHHAGQCVARAHGRVRLHRRQGIGACRGAGRGDRGRRNADPGFGAVDPARDRRATQRHRQARSGIRRQARQVASRGQDEPAAGDDSRRRRHGRKRHRRDGDRSRACSTRVGISRPGSA